MSLATQVSAGFAAVGNEINTLQRPLTTRTVSYSNGGIGGQNASFVSGATTEITLTNTSIRIPIRLPATTTQWRIKLRNYDSLLSATKAPLTGNSVVMGAMTASSAGATAQTGSFAGGTATTAVSSSFTIPGDGTYYTSPWVTTTQFQQGADFLVAVAFQAPSSLTMQTGIGQCWYWADNTSAVNPAIVGSAAANTASWIPIDWVIEYQVTSRQRAFLIIGDSISEGTTGPAYAVAGTATNAAPTPLWHGQWEQWAARRGAIVQRNCLYASPASTWASPTYTGWTRQATSGGAYSGAVLALGANDIKGGQTFAQLQTSYIACITNLRNIVGSSVPLYALTVMAESMSGSAETYRLQFNNWLSQIPAGVTAAIDVESEMRSSSTSALDAELTCDSIHPSYQGQSKLADVLLAAIP